MDYKPSDFFIGVIDIFAILLPGSLFAFTTQDFAAQHLFGRVFPAIQGGAQSGIAFLFAAYLFGHFIFMIGSFLDHLLYDPYRKLFLIKNRDQLYETATRIRKSQLKQLTDEEIVNTFKWARAKLQLYHPTVSTEISRLEADSKFFRSLVVVLLIIALSLVIKSAWIEIVVCLLLTLLAFVRYADQRFKSTELAYIYLIAAMTAQETIVANFEVKGVEKNTDRHAN